MKNKVLKSIVAVGVFSAMTLTLTINTNESNQIDSTIDNFLALNQASAEISGSFHTCLGLLSTQCCPESSTKGPRVNVSF